MRPKIKPTDVENIMREEDFIVSKTDLKGIITYCNQIFMEFAVYKEHELLGQNHNIIRHPSMPRIIFKVLWDTIQAGNEINAYIKNLASDGSFYWVFANVTPVMDENQKIVGYYAVRRKPKRSSLKIIEPLYRDLLNEEKKYSNAENMKYSGAMLNEFLKEKGKSYEEYILSI